MSNRKKGLFGLYLISLFLLSWWVIHRKTPRNHTGKYLVVGTTGMIGDALKRIGGDRIVVCTLMGPGVDPHNYKMSLQDGELLMEQADMVFYNGLHLEQMHFVLERTSKRPDKVFYAVGKALDPSEVLRDPQFKNGQDPHIFHDVGLWMECVRYIGEKLIVHDPKNSDVYRENMEVYLEELAALHEEVKQMLGVIPSTQRYLITAHDAFGYYARAYGLQVKSLQGISTVSGMGLYDREELKAFIIAHGIKVIFTENSVCPKSIQAVKESCEKEGYVLDTDELFSDALPEGGSYVDMLRINTYRIARAFSGGSQGQG